MGRSGGTSCPNDRAERYRSMQSRYRTRQTKIYLFAFKSGSPEQTKTMSVCYGEKRRYELLSMIEQSDIIRATSLPNATSSVFTTLLSNATSPNARAEGSITPKANQNSVCLLSIGVPRANQDFICLLWGEAEVRVAFNDRAERYHSRNLVTERDERVAVYIHLSFQRYSL